MKGPNLLFIGTALLASLLLLKLARVKEDEGLSLRNTSTRARRLSLLPGLSDPKTISLKEIVLDGYGNKYIEYIPGVAEDAVMQNIDSLGFGSPKNPNACFLWDPNSSSTNPDFKANFAGYLEGLEKHTEALNSFGAIPNLMESIKRDGGSHAVCDSTRLHPGGIAGFFPPGQLSLSQSGYIEPLLPPMRHPKICENRSAYLMNMEYLVHDYEAMCLKLKPHSKLVFIDMGASLAFHGSGAPVMKLLEDYEKFGFHFDHIFGMEITFQDPKEVYENLLPEKYMHTYHWINVGVTAEDGNKLNPLNSILQEFEEDDFIVVKLDIDTPSIELPLAQQLLENDIYSRLVDQFYFEHHVHLGEMKNSWRKGMAGTVKDSMELFSGLRKKGIPAHSWV